MQTSVMRSISQSEVVADLCSCNKLLEESSLEDYDDPEWDLQCAYDEDHQDEVRAQNIYWVKSHRPEVTDEEALNLNAEFEVYYKAGNSFDDALEWSGIAENPHPTVRFVRRFDPFCSEQECFEKYKVYRSYRDEGQSDIVSRQYAGLL